MTLRTGTQGLGGTGGAATPCRTQRTWAPEVPSAIKPGVDRGLGCWGAGVGFAEILRSPDSWFQTPRSHRPACRGQCAPDPKPETNKPLADKTIKGFFPCKTEWSQRKATFTTAFRSLRAAAGPLTTAQPAARSKAGAWPGASQSGAVKYERQPRDQVSQRGLQSARATKESL